VTPAEPPDASSERHHRCIDRYRRYTGRCRRHTSSCKREATTANAGAANPAAAGLRTATAAGIAMPLSAATKHHADFLHTRAPIFTFLPASRGQEAGGTYVDTPLPSKESVGAPDQMTTSQQVRGVTPLSSDPLSPPVCSLICVLKISSPSSLFCNLCINYFFQY
jgi:hypothetical protein